MVTPDPNRKKEDNFFGKLTGLLDAGPERSILPGRKKRRVGDIVGEVCDEQACSAQKTQPVRPWVYEDYLVRLKSFKASTWFAMPLEISPLECARQGWTNSGPSTLKCLSCGVEIVHSDGVPAADFRASLSTRHENYCGWNDNPSSESFCYFQLDSKSAYQKKFNSRCQLLVKTLCEEGSAVGDALGHFMLKNLDCSGMSRFIEKNVVGSCESVLSAKSLALELLDINHKGVENPGEILDLWRSGGEVSFPLKLAPEGLCLEKEDEPKAAKIYLRKIISAISIIAIFGWAPIHSDDPEHEAGVDLCCDTCGRTVSFNSEADSAPLNAINQHRFFCPWIAVNRIQPCGWELFVSNVFDSSGSGPGPSGPAAGVAGSPTVSSTVSSPFSVDRSGHDPSSGKKEPLDMFKRIQSVMSMLSNSPYHSSPKYK